MGFLASLLCGQNCTWLIRGSSKLPSCTEALKVPTINCTWLMQRVETIRSGLDVIMYKGVMYGLIQLHCLQREAGESGLFTATACDCAETQRVIA